MSIEGRDRAETAIATEQIPSQPEVPAIAPIVPIPNAAPTPLASPRPYVGRAVFAISSAFWWLPLLVLPSLLGLEIIKAGSYGWGMLGLWFFILVLPTVFSMGLGFTVAGTFYGIELVRRQGRPRVFGVIALFFHVLTIAMFVGGYLWLTHSK